MTLGSFEHEVLAACRRLKGTPSISDVAAELADIAASYGAVHIVVKRMETKGLLTTSNLPARPIRGGCARVGVSITDQGWQALDEHEERLRIIITRRRKKGPQLPETPSAAHRR